MRPIKFKIWYPDSSLMEGPFDIDLLYTQNSVHPKFVTSDKHYYLQYTGFHDKNGKEIYEGDIISYQGRPFTARADVSAVYEAGTPLIVEFRCGSFCVNTPWFEIDSLFDMRYSILGFEVIGNIYQNPEKDK